MIKDYVEDLVKLYAEKKKQTENVGNVEKSWRKCRKVMETTGQKKCGRRKENEIRNLFHCIVFQILIEQLRSKDPYKVISMYKIIKYLVII